MQTMENGINICGQSYIRREVLNETGEQGMKICGQSRIRRRRTVAGTQIYKA